MKKFPLILSLILIISLLAGCAGTPVVYYTNCTCPADAHDEAAADVPMTIPSYNETPALSEGALKTGIAISTSISDSKSATADAEGQAKYTVNIAAVLVDEDGIIRSCIIDCVDTDVKFNAEGAIKSKLEAEILTKGEKGEAYGMKASGSKYEWNEQVDKLAEYAIGKTAEQLMNGAVDEAGKAKNADLASVASIYLGGHVADIVKAAENAEYLGAKSGDELKMAVMPKISESKAAAADKDGTAQLDVDVVAMTMNGETITSCKLDSVQAKVVFTADGAINEQKTDINAPVATKNELGENYGMVAWGGAIAEWDAQAAAFAAYVTGKTPAEVAGIAITEATKPADADLAASVTISVIGFMNLIAKAAN